MESRKLESTQLIEGDLYYLMQSFRFGPAIAALANNVLKDLENSVY